MSLPATFPLLAANGKTVNIPSVGYGTWASSDSWKSGENGPKDAVLAALKAGYRHLDCAWMYGIDSAVGEAIRESGVPRDEIFITSKFWPHFGHPADVSLCLDKILSNMGLGYLDLYLAHWPCVWQPTSRSDLENARAGGDADAAVMGIKRSSDDKPVIDWSHCTANIAKIKGEKGSFVPTWKAMQECVKSGKAKTVGVSNFSIPELEELLPYAQAAEGGNEVPLSCNQVEVHPWLPQTELVEFAKKHDIVISCYSPFAGQKSDGATLLQDATVKKLAEKNGMDVGQLLGSWAVQRGTVPLGKSATPSRIKTNLDVKKLSKEDVEVLDALELKSEEGRTVNFTEAWGVPLFRR